MGKFKEFMENQTIGLGDLGRRINHLYHSDDLGNQISGALTSTDVTGTEQPSANYAGHPLHLPDIDLTVPSIVRTGRISILQLKKNPIYIRLSDGTEANFTWDEYRKIEGSEPAVGKTMTVIFQRHPRDISQMYSKIDKAIVRD